MNLDELRQAMASDATKENERLKSEINLLREQLRDSKSDYEVLERFTNHDCQVLTNRCWVLTRGTMCCFCSLDAFECPHAWSDEEIIKAAKKLRGRDKNERDSS